MHSHWPFGLPARWRNAFLRLGRLRASLLVAAVAAVVSVTVTWLILVLFSLPASIYPPMLLTAAVVPVIAALPIGGFIIHLMHEAEQARAYLHEVAIRDGLTRVFNRRYFMERGAEEFSKAVRHGNPLALMILDIDNFKRINDEHGHVAGDAVLQTFARTCEAALRQHDVLARYGGEEFAVLLPLTSRDGARRAAERLLLAVQQAATLTESGKEVRFTVSIGLATLDSDADTLELLLVRADSALYRSKNAGKNQWNWA